MKRLGTIIGGLIGWVLQIALVGLIPGLIWALCTLPKMQAETDVAVRSYDEWMRTRTEAMTKATAFHDSLLTLYYQEDISEEELLKAAGQYDWHQRGY